MSLVQIALKRPFPQPFKEIFSVDYPVKLRFIPMKATRLCLPSDYANYKLILWNQKYSYAYGTPWFDAINYSREGANGIASIAINSGNAYLYYANYTLPSAGRIAGFISTNNWNHNKVNMIFSFEFYLKNNLEEMNPSVLYDDNEEIWSVYRDGSGSFDINLSEELNEKIKGASSLKVAVTSGTYASIGYQINFASLQDWSNKEFLCWYFYGMNSGLIIKARIIDNNGNWGEWNFTDNFTGWKRFVKPLLKRDSQSDTNPNLSQISTLRFYFNPSSISTYYHDRTLIDIGQWIKVEVNVPNKLRSVHSSYSYPKGYLYTWDISTQSWKKCWEFYCELSSDNFYLMDGTRLIDIYSSSPSYRRGQVGYLEGMRGETKSNWRADGATDSPKYIKYLSAYGCKQRLGFAVKLPPDDGQASSNYGISQAKLKLEVYYDNYGETTYEFENSSNHNYGLMNMNKNWLVLYDPDSKNIEYLIFTKRPIAIEMNADHNKYVKYIDITLQKGTRVFAGSLYHSDHSRDSDNDGVKDVFEENKWIPLICESVYFHDF